MTAMAPIGLAVDLSTAGTAKVATVGEDGRFDPAEIAIFSDASVSTLTGVFMAFEREAGRSLRDSNVALAIPGVPGRAAVAILRSRWMLSRDGLNQFFERPVTVVNDGAAKAWAVLGEHGLAAPIGDTPRLSPLPELGRRALIQFEAGLGATLIDRDADGRHRVLETEMGHLAFAPVEEVDERIVHELRAARQPTSWESVLRVAQGAQPSAVFAALPQTQKRELLIRWAADFVSSTVLAMCAWDGVYLTGSGWSVLKEPAAGRALMSRLRRSRVFPRQFEALPCWHIEQKHDVLRGCAQILLSAAKAGR
jgi:glucokinase